MKMNAPADVAFNDPTPEGAAYRGEQAHIDADIEGLARDPDIEALMNRLVEEGLSAEECIERTFDAIRSRKKRQTPAAE